MTSDVITAAGVLIALNAGVLWYQIKKDRNYASQAEAIVEAFAEQQRREWQSQETEAANSEEPEGDSREGARR